VIRAMAEARPDGGRIILDVGCGAGRDAITLAYAFPDHRVVAIDNLARALERVAQFAAREGRDNVLPCRAVIKGKGTLTAAVADALASIGGGRGEGSVVIGKPVMKSGHSGVGAGAATTAAAETVATAAAATAATAAAATAAAAAAAAASRRKRRHHGVKQGSNVSLILLSRFLNRDVMYDDCVRLLRPGGYILVHHFLMSCAKPKQPHHKLEEGELAREFAARGLEVVRDDVFVAPDDGRELTMFVARKPESGRTKLSFLR
jgi:precorrin-6B methylase 2